MMARIVVHNNKGQVSIMANSPQLNYRGSNSTPCKRGGE